MTGGAWIEGDDKEEEKPKMNKKAKESKDAKKKKKERAAQKRTERLKRKMARVLTPEEFFREFGETIEEYLKRRECGWANVARGKVQGWDVASSLHGE